MVLNLIMNAFALEYQHIFVVDCGFKLHNLFKDFWPILCITTNCITKINKITFDRGTIRTGN